MDQRTRRSVIGGTGLGLATIVAGCLDEMRSGADGEPTDGAGATDENGDGRDGNEGDRNDGEGTEGDGPIVHDPRVDEPPHEVEPPDEIEFPEYEDGDDWNEHYLGEAMAAEPSVDFDAVSRVTLHEPLVRYGPDTSGNAYAARLIENRDELDAAIDLDATPDEARSTLDAVDFDDRVVVVVESGFGSSSVTHEWSRVEANERALHAHGYYVMPFVQTTDYAARYSAVVADRSAVGGSLDYVRVSLTVAEDSRVHFNSTEGIVTVES